MNTQHIAQTDPVPLMIRDSQRLACPASTASSACYVRAATVAVVGPEKAAALSRCGREPSTTVCCPSEDDEHISGAQ
ncbi:unnamed protein product [Schistocephalus solidus]|uniref:Uncharacterized protein n=1 Tax=Schistocephalus solidus TaxID=70667 RepID=A0A183S9Z6_SCHSO|nr:unnamed protein product [Schistocephalus solidus]